MREWLLIMLVPLTAGAGYMGYLGYKKLSPSDTVKYAGFGALTLLFFLYSILPLFAKTPHRIAFYGITALALGGFWIVALADLILGKTRRFSPISIGALLYFFLILFAHGKWVAYALGSSISFTGYLVSSELLARLNKKTNIIINLALWIWFLIIGLVIAKIITII